MGLELVSRLAARGVWRKNEEFMGLWIDDGNVLDLIDDSFKKF